MGFINPHTPVDVSMLFYKQVEASFANVSEIDLIIEYKFSKLKKKRIQKLS